ncbi:MAG: hypothetical protein N7Q72_02755 [Spiroplasma sp. Tabriz.8]|nr:hypothetical protein [Spiroplasma sp. Tabriz.8]
MASTKWKRKWLQILKTAWQESFNIYIYIYIYIYSFFTQPQILNF